MATHISPHRDSIPGLPDPSAETAVDPDAVRRALAEVLASPPFRTSRQCQSLLSYMVEHSLAGEDSSLRERVIGVEVFHRPGDYDTSEDPVVRMRAADIRKRLAQFYQSTATLGVRIELKPGSYRALFRSHPDVHGGLAPVEVPPVERLESPVTQGPRERTTSAAAHKGDEVQAPAGGRRWRLPLLVSLCAALTLCLLVYAAGKMTRLWPNRTLAGQRQFWAPLRASGRPVLIYLGSNVAYRFTPDFLARYRRDHDLQQNGPEFFPMLRKGSAVQSDDLVPVKGTFVTVGDVAASTDIVSLLNSWGQPFLLRSAEDLSMSDVRNAPAVFIGGFNNPWSLETTESLPLRFRDGTSIVSNTGPAVRWSIDAPEGAPPSVDYALISRVCHSTTGGPVITIGGIGSFGTQAAAEFIASPEKLEQLMQSAPSKWRGENMQALLKIRVVQYAPTQVEIVKTLFW